MMANGPNYRVPFRRRREGKTNFYLRRSLLVSGRSRVIIRPSSKNITCQVANARLQGDMIVAAATSKELVKDYGWTFGTGNLPCAYLTGYLLGKKATAAGVSNAIADIGLRVHMNRTYAAMKGVIDGGIDVPASDEVFPDEERLNGKHIENYVQKMSNSTGERPAGSTRKEKAKKKAEPVKPAATKGGKGKKKAEVVEVVEEKEDEESAYAGSSKFQFSKTGSPSNISSKVAEVKQKIDRKFA
jgi:large subunit ribosomal protein L18